jgi:aryl-alcohol dehydrogenase-like predicted oxidoreductase
LRIDRLVLDSADHQRGVNRAKSMGSMDKAQSFKLLDAYYDAGGNFIDTANHYQDEQSEKWIGEWMQ